MNRRRVWGLVVLGVAFHAVWLLSIFDIYFKSPVVRGVAEVASAAPPQRPPPARRVVLIVGDGCRADRLFETCAAGGAPHFRAVAERRGAWGVSHTRVPTESRPCHVAMCAGLYEDVSAVMRGWSSNPVDFDSVFNASRAAWGFGSPDIIPMFAALAPHMRAESYLSAHEDFGDEGEGAGSLDEWVFEHVEALFKRAAENSTLADELRTEGSVFFLHLLALDTLGHAAKPHSRRYTAQIEAVDAGVARMERLFDDFFGHDGATSFVFTGDHGMSDRGSHGDGCKENTRTPLLVWGAGVRGALSVENNADVVTADSFPTPAEWNLSGISARHDVSQADLAPLMAALIGAHFPVNSVGTLPVGLLSASKEHRAWLLFQNAKQILAMYHHKHELRRAVSRVAYVEYAPLSETAVHDAVAEVERALAEGRADDAFLLSYALIERSLRGLSYLQKYDWPLLMALVVLGYLLWMALVVASISEWKSPGGAFKASEQNLRAAAVAIGSACAALLAYLAAQGRPPVYFLYGAFPFFLAWQVAKRWPAFKAAVIRASSFDTALNAAGSLLACFAALAFALAYYDRRAISVGFLLLSVFLPVAVAGRSLSSKATIRWAVLCIGCAVFPLLPEAMNDNPRLLALGGIALFAATLPLGKGQPISEWLRSALVLVATAIDVAFSLRIFPTAVIHVLAWIVLIFSVAPWSIQSKASSGRVFESVKRFMRRVSPVFVLMSVSHEPLFLGLFCALLLQWPRLSLRPWENVHVVIYMFFCYASFFSTGNVASISGFELASTYRFVTVFSPFLMTALLGIKIVIPFAVVACSFYALRDRSEDGFVAAFGLSDVTAIAFFFLVRDQGSWLDIGLSIGNFAISNLFIVIQLLLLLLARAVLGSKSSAALQKRGNVVSR